MVLSEPSGADCMRNFALRTARGCAPGFCLNRSCPALGLKLALLFRNDAAACTVLRVARVIALGIRSHLGLRKRNCR